MKKINNNSLFSNVMSFIFVFFFLFGIKIACLDLSVFVPLFILFLATRNSIKFNKQVLSVAFLIAILMIYQNVLQLFLQTFDFDSLLRLFRAVMVCIMVAVIVGSAPFSSNQILSSIFYSILFQAICIDIAAFVEPINNLLSFLSGNNRVRVLRASGFLAGFDIAGLFCIIGSLMLSLKIYTHRSNLILLIFHIIFGLGSFFTSRVSMVLFILVFALVNSTMLFNSKKNVLYKVFIFIVLSFFIIFISWKYIVPIVAVTFSLGLINVSDDLCLEIVSRHAVQPDVNKFLLWPNMFFLPDSVWGLVFGTGVNVMDSDVGYVKDIFRYGLVGVIYSFAIYFYIYNLANSVLKRCEIRYYLIFLTIIFSMVFLLTFKNNYFFTRGIFPFIMLVVCVPIIHIREVNLKLASK